MQVCSSPHLPVCVPIVTRSPSALLALCSSSDASVAPSPGPHEVVFHLGSAGGEAAGMSWCYGEPRVVTRLKVSPVPFCVTTEGDVPVDLRVWGGGEFPLCPLRWRVGGGGECSLCPLRWRVWGGGECPLCAFYVTIKMSNINGPEVMHGRRGWAYELTRGIQCY